MASSLIELSNEEWTRITAAGESGTCWKKAGSQVVIDHTDQETDDTLPLSNENVTVGKSKRVPLDMDSDDVLGIPADNVSDIYYALAVNEDSSNLLAVDVI